MLLLPDQSATLVLSHGPRSAGLRPPLLRSLMLAPSFEAVCREEERVPARIRSRHPIDRPQRGNAIAIHHLQQRQIRVRLDVVRIGGDLRLEFALGIGSPSDVRKRVAGSVVKPARQRFAGLAARLVSHS